MSERCPCLDGRFSECTLPAIPVTKWAENDAKLARMNSSPAVANGENKKVRSEQLRKDTK